MYWDFVLRLVVAGVLGGIVGWDREYRAKEAGLRTHFLVAIGSALIMIVSQHGFADVLGKPGIGLDPSRIAAQVVSGIGFIGAGTILIQKQFVRGLTTAAGLWATSGIGLAVGAGMYWVGVCAMVLTLVGLEFLTIVFKNVGEHSSLLVFSTKDKENLKRVANELHIRNYRIGSYDVQQERSENTDIYHVTLVVKTKRHIDETLLFQFLQDLPDLTLERMS
ncbi:MAG: methyltransferase [Odoribacter splanchnicus]|nr:methyltransferase [Odoribacter splanchnicus]MBD9179816.1 methyltransferase [Odoribacter splanchnicus]